MAKKGVTKARRRDFELQSSELWGNKNDLSAQLQIQLIGFETKSVPFFLRKVSTLYFSAFFGTHLTWSWVKSQKWSEGPSHMLMWPSMTGKRWLLMATEGPPTLQSGVIPAWNYVPQLPGKVTPTSSPIVNAARKWKSTKKLSSQMCKTQSERKSPQWS